MEEPIIINVQEAAPGSAISISNPGTAESSITRVRPEEPNLSPDAEEQMNIVDHFELQYPEMSQAFKQSFLEQLTLIAGKMLDYGINNMKAGTNLETEEDVRFALTGIWFRISDKMARWQNLLKTGHTPNYESLYDTFMDIANYAMFAKLISRGLWSGK